MSYAALLSPLAPQERLHWKRYVSDSFLALGSISLITGIIFLFHLYPSIQDSLLIYLLVILALASTRGLYSALLASFIAFFSFDFLFVPPVYSLIVTKFEDVLALIVFLVTSITTGQLTSVMRQRTEDAHRRERETHILYDLVRNTNREVDMEHQLSIFTRVLVEVFSSWGICSCALLLPDTEGILQIGAQYPNASIVVSSQEKAGAAQVMEHARIIDLPDAIADHTTTENSSIHHRIRLIPLKTEQKVVGIIRLCIKKDARQLPTDIYMGMEHEHPPAQAVFFSTFLEQAVTMIERGRLQRDNLRVQVLQQTDSLRVALLSSVSHDLRTPLSIIKTAATSILQEEVQWDAEALSSFALTIESETDRLNRLVENLLDMSRIESGVLSPKRVWYPLEDVVHDVLGRMRSLLHGRSIQIHQPDTLPPVELDYILISQVITNLVENAVYYTPDGSPIDVSIQVQGAMIVVSIADRGLGIPQKEREYIFDKFYRVLINEHTAPHHRGSGLGLAVSKGIIEAHGGRIWVEPRIGGGALFCFTLPRNEESDE